MSESAAGATDRSSSRHRHRHRAHHHSSGSGNHHSSSRHRSSHSARSDAQDVRSSGRIAKEQSRDHRHGSSTREQRHRGQNEFHIRAGGERGKDGEDAEGRNDNVEGSAGAIEVPEESGKVEEQQGEQEAETNTEMPVVYTEDPVQFLCLLSQVLRLPSLTLCTSLIYMHQYNAYVDAQRQLHDTEQKEDTYHEPIFDKYSLVMTCLSLACKATECPRRLRELLVPASHILHRDSSPRLTFPSTLYDSFRAGIVHFELVLLRILRYETEVQTAFLDNSALLESVLDAGVCGNLHGIVQLRNIIRGTFRSGAQAPELARARDGHEYAAEFGIVNLLATEIGGRAQSYVVQCYKREESALRFRPVQVAVAAVFLAVEEEGYVVAGRGCEGWVRATVERLVEGGEKDEEEEDEEGGGRTRRVYVSSLEKEEVIAKSIELIDLLQKERVKTALSYMPSADAVKDDG